MIAPPPPPLRLLRPDEALPAADDVLVRPRATPSLVVAIVFSGLAWLVVSGWPEGKMPLAAALFFAAVFALVAGVGFTGWRRSLRRDAWMMAIGPRRVLIRFRSFLHVHFPADDPQLVEVPLQAVAWVRRTHQHITRPFGRATQHRHYTYLDVHLHPADLEPLRRALAREATLKHRGTRFDHQPVIVTVEGAIRVELAYNGASTRPRAADVLRLLGERVPVQDAATERTAAARASAL